MSEGQLQKGKRFSDGSRGNTRGHRNLNGKVNKDRRREEAFAREAAYNKLSLTDKLKGLPIDGAKRQRARYTELLAKQAEKSASQPKKKKSTEATA